MKIYLAARYSRYQEMQRHRNLLTGLGHIITSRWIDGGHQIDDLGLSCEAEQTKREQFAIEDLNDLSAADIVVSFTEEPRKTNSRGGRHVEHGIAIGMGKKTFVIGFRENVFHCLPQVTFDKTIDELIGLL